MTHINHMSEPDKAWKKIQEARKFESELMRFIAFASSVNGDDALSAIGADVCQLAQKVRGYHHNALVPNSPDADRIAEYNPLCKSFRTAHKG